MKQQEAVAIEVKLRELTRSIERLIAKLDTTKEQLAHSQEETLTVHKDLSVIIASLEDKIVRLKRDLSGTTMCYDPDSYKAGMEEAANIAGSIQYRTPYSGEQTTIAILKRIKEIPK